jgi:hypothetical protein
VLDDNSCMRRAIIAPLLSNVNSLLHTSIKDEVTAQGLDLACGPTKTPSDVIHRTAALAQHSLPPICKHGSLKVPRYRPKCPSRRGSGGEDSLDAPQQRLQAPATYVAPAGYRICCAIAIGPGSGNPSLRLSSDHEFHSCPFTLTRIFKGLSRQPLHVCRGDNFTLRGSQSSSSSQS